MVYAQTVLDALAYGLKDSGRLPAETSYATLELNSAGAHADVSPPIIEVQLASLTRDQSRNTEQVGYVTDAHGNHIGRQYRTWFDLTAQISCITAESGPYDSRTMERRVREALRLYDTAQLGERLPDPSGSGPLLDVSKLSHREMVIQNNLSMTPAMRRTQLSVDVAFHDEYKSTDYTGPEDYIASVSTPNADDIVVDPSTDASLSGRTSDDT